MIELVVGGARSGKSAYAERRALQSGGIPVYIATATAGDEEMAERIARHREGREDRWKLVEEPFYLSEILSGLNAQEAGVVDCLTLWMSNWLCSGDREGWHAERKRFFASLENMKGSLWLVSNETGMGIIPEHRLAREFVDESGRLHQDIAARADTVVQMVCGIPNMIKDTDEG